MEDKFSPPWFDKLERDKTSTSRYEITIELAEDVHSGYCSDHEDMEVVKSIVTKYLPEGSWGNFIYEWDDEVPGHCCCCESRIHYRVLTVTLLPLSSAAS